MPLVQIVLAGYRQQTDTPSLAWADFPLSGLPRKLSQCEESMSPQKFTTAVCWEFNTRIGGEGRDCREAMLDALSKSRVAVLGASDFVMEAVERNETWSVADRLVQRPQRRSVETRVAFCLVVVFIICSFIFWHRYQTLERACVAHGNTVEYCWDLGR